MLGGGAGVEIGGGSGDEGGENRVKGRVDGG